MGQVRINRRWPTTSMRCARANTLHPNMSSERVQMDTVTTIAAVRERVRGWRRAGLRVAFIPTMGNLHPAHVSLMEAPRRHGVRFVASIFVNPMQFGPNEDFAHSPRTPRADERMLAEAGCSLM